MVRGPCPALNSLANHGILPRNGKRMTYPTLLKGILEGLNVGFDLTLVAGTGGMIGAKNPLQLYFNLDDLANHDFFNATIWQSVLDYFIDDRTGTLELIGSGFSSSKNGCHILRDGSDHRNKRMR
ncbi:predicted protein [Histoplasma mississippiense (nom. inval.)]|uniref:predicted protein n=1 Tax=Ajellomyces capsulatus (strain NAm1 / WU24) TaxID=2059318 RepID=UPI000157B41A|nr:predicted protein [Histoplasma mississippiense (nom. inval.)]EDN02765.1 predicted protein [Histoplasma mississippiense (nom. inval.)]